MMENYNQTVNALCEKLKKDSKFFQEKKWYKLIEIEKGDTKVEIFMNNKTETIHIESKDDEVLIKFENKKVKVSAQREDHTNTSENEFDKLFPKRLIEAINTGYYVPDKLTGIIE